MLVFAGLSPHPPLLIPEVGGGELARVENTVEGMRAWAKAAAEAKPETAVFISPHGCYFRGSLGYQGSKELTGSFAAFGVPQVNFKVANDLELARAIGSEAEKVGVEVIEVVRSFHDLSQPKGLDHGVMVPLYYLREAGVEPSVVAFGICSLPLEKLYQFGCALGEAISQSEKRVALIASGDMSHRLLPGAPNGYDPLGQVFDQKIRKLLQEVDVEGILNLPEDLIEHAGECGLRPIVMLMGALQKYQVESKIHSYEGPFGVGYLVADFKLEAQKEDTKLSSCVRGQQKEHSPYVQLAYDSLKHYLHTHKYLPTPNPLPEEMKRRAGVFVSLKKHDQLRGCIGTILPTQPNLASEIIHNAVSAALRDPRFLPVEEDELSELKISVDVLEKPEPVHDASELDPKRFGVIVSRGERKGLLLPDLEGIDTVEEQVSIARQKAGIAPDEPVELERFTVTRYE